MPARSAPPSPVPNRPAAPGAGPVLGDVLRYWRQVRSKSQLDLASEAMTTPRYISFVETGRSQPSREMVLRLARALDVPLRERNGLLLAAGYAPVYPHRSLDAPESDQVRLALGVMLEQQEPFPAVVMDRGWNVLRVNGGARRLFGGLYGSVPMPDPTNALQMMIEPGPVRDHVENWDQVVPALLERARREAVGGVLDLVTAELVHRLRTRPEVAALADEPMTAVPLPVVDIRFSFEDTSLHFFSVVSTIGTPIDVTAQELRVEAFFPSDETTRARWSINAT
jgi:transcriptional regulator with XRE-family HTH domain